MSTPFPARPTRPRARELALLCSGLALSGAASSAHAQDVDDREGSARSASVTGEWSERAPRFWWPTVVLERSSAHLTGARSVDETRFGLGLAFRTSSLSPHVRLLISPSLGSYENLAGSASAGLRVHFELAGVPLSYGVGVSIEARLRDSLWLAHATPIELGTALYRGGSAEHYVFVGARHSMAGALINSYLLDPNGYDNEDSLDQLSDLRDAHAWQLYVSVVFGRRVE